MNKIALQLEKHGIPMKCGRCSHEWTYRGLNKWYSCCGHCRTYNSIEKHRLDTQGFPTKSSPESLEVKSKEVLDLS